MLEALPGRGRRGAGEVNEQFRNQGWLEWSILKLCGESAANHPRRASSASEYAVSS